MKKHTMPGFMTYREVALIYAALDDETAGKVIKAVCDYYCFGFETDGFTDRAAEIYDTMLCKMEKDQASYNKRCDANRDNGKKGGRPPKGGNN